MGRSPGDGSPRTQCFATAETLGRIARATSSCTANNHSPVDPSFGRVCCRLLARFARPRWQPDGWRWPSGPKVLTVRRRRKGQHNCPRGGRSRGQSAKAGWLSHPLSLDSPKEGEILQVELTAECGRCPILSGDWYIGTSTAATSTFGATHPVGSSR
jgi:hypothetical protein